MQADKRVQRLAASEIGFYEDLQSLVALLLIILALLSFLKRVVPEVIVALDLTQPTASYHL
jgi:hypothetical protein